MDPGMGMWDQDATPKAASARRIPREGLPIQNAQKTMYNCIMQLIPMSTQTTKQTNERTNEWISHRSINEQIKKVDIFYFQHGHGNDVLAMMNHDKPPFKFGHLLKPKRRFPSKLSSLHWQPTSWRWAEWHPAKHRTHHRGELHTHTTSWHPHMLHTDILTQTRTMMDHVIYVYIHANTHLFIYIYCCIRKRKFFAKSNVCFFSQTFANSKSFAGPVWSGNTSYSILWRLSHYLHYCQYISSW